MRRSRRVDRSIRNREAALHIGRLKPGERVTIPDAPFAHV
jgi:hypothetical protein